MTIDCARRCGLDISPTHGVVTGVGGSSSTNLIGSTTAFVYQNPHEPDLLLHFKIVQQTTVDLPSYDLPRSHWYHLDDLELADPDFHRSRTVDIIFGSDVFDKVDRCEIIHSVGGSPNSRKTSFGWVISGKYRQPSTLRVRFHPSTINNEGTSTLCCRTYTKHATHIQRQIENDCTPTCSSDPQPQRTNWPGTRGQSMATSDPSYPVDCRCLRSNSVQAPLSAALTSALEGNNILVPRLVSLSSTIILEHSKNTDPEYAELLSNMFKLESVADVPPLSPDELLAEEIFRKTCSRDREGRFIVGLPLKGDPAQLGDSRRIALRFLYRLEHRHRKNPSTRAPYVDFMEDYLKSGHMKPVPPSTPGQICYYLPHHSVHRAQDPPSKIRVVFNASQKTPSGLSLNDLLLPGPRLQLDIGDVVTRFRQDRWVFSADIRQMFRQVAHRPEDCDLLRIVWRSDPQMPIQDFQLTTVTYGTASAPFLAGRVLAELAQTHQTSHPEATEVLQQRTYVDDLNGGGDTVDHALAVRDQVIDLLRLAKLELRKWASNHPELLSGIPKDHVLPTMSSVDLDVDVDGKSDLKMLGLSWDPLSDSFHYRLTTILKIKTKRELARQIGKVFDPLGWLIPVTIYARGIFRKICQASFQWDDPLPHAVTLDWAELASSLHILATLQIPRWMPIVDRDLWLVGFADASEHAYAAVLYLVSRKDGKSEINLVTSKARMAPVKALTLPRLELCAAQLLSRTFKKALPLFPQVHPDRMIAFSDSTITLSWVTAQPAPVWKVFVGNRVADILSTIPHSQWFHVESAQNPADCGSRGLLPEQLKGHTLWWSGPQWLKEDPYRWPLRRIRPDLQRPEVHCEAKSHQLNTSVLSSMTSLNDSLELRYSSLATLQNVVAWCLRFKWNASKRLPKRFGPLQSFERKEALNALIKRSQAQALLEEFKDAQQARPKLRLVKKLALFIDHEGVMRVGGRLRHADLPDTIKHPALMPADHPLTRLVIKEAHEACLHVGPQATHAFIRSKFWIVNGRNVVRWQLAKCNLCFSVKPRPYTPPMGQLPKDRVTAVTPFNVTGVDYAGPFQVSSTGLRGSRILEVYLAIFLCFTTKAVHIEVVSDRSTPKFLEAYSRFIGRRGHPSVVWSDNGTNFLGAANDMRRLRSLLRSPDHQDACVRRAAENITEWRFIPPHAPHFGGLWEAAVKSAKRLLKLTLRNQVPSWETFQTVTVQVEAVLNSRPLVAVSSSPDDLAVLTPAHFLVQRPLTALPPEPNLDDRSSLRSKWLFVQNAMQRFWKRWLKEYLLQCQERVKWTSSDQSAKTGDIVIVINENAPPLQWELGKIITLTPGIDGEGRVAEVKTERGIIKRPVHKLCPLPNQ